MSEPAGLQHPLGIEAVHWSAGTGSDLVVRVAGRWRRRRTPNTVPPVLAIDTEHQRYRFPAHPEPPSVRGAQPGLWQVSFTIPAALAPYLAGRLTLMLGSVSISLPPAVADPGEPAATGTLRAVEDADVLADRRDARRRAADAEAATSQVTNGEAAALPGLEVELTQAHNESERLATELALAERRRREAEQLAHSERAMRLDLGRDHAERIRRHQADARAVLELLDAAQAHAEDLGHEIELLRRSGGEVVESPQRSERRTRALAAELTLARLAPAALVARAAPAPVALAAGGEPPGLALERAMQAGRARRRTTRYAPDAEESKLAGALLHLAAVRAEGEEVLGRAAPDPEHVHAAYVTDAIEAIARQLAAVRATVALLPVAAAQEVGRAEALANAPEARRPCPPARPVGAVAPAPARPVGAVAPDRLAAALSRLREESPPPETAPEGSQPPAAPGRPAGPATLAAELRAAREMSASGSAAPRRDEAPAAAAPGAAAGGEVAALRVPAAMVPAPAAVAPAPAPMAPAVPVVPAAVVPVPETPAVPAATGPRSRTSGWLLPTLRRLLRDDPAVVGNLLIRLVPAQPLVVAGPVSYDIALTGAGCLAVTVRDDRVRLDVLGAPRPSAEVDFRIEGDLEALARLVLYGRVRRRISRRVARIRGDRRAFAALHWLVREPLGLRELHAAGLRLDPELALRLVANMIEPAWTAGQRFTVGHESASAGGRVYLFVRDGERPRVSRQPPLGPVATTIRCPDERLLALLAGESGVEIPLRGAAAPVVLVRDWIARAQRDS